MSGDAAAHGADRSTAEPPQRSDRAAQKRARIARTVTLGVVLVAITAIGLAHQRGVNVVGVDALCPFGGIETFWSLLSAGTLVQRIAASSVVLLVGVVATALVFRRAFCGYVCPLGAIQEFAAKLGGLVWLGRRPEMPAWLDRPARYLKYAALVLITVWTAQAASLVIRPYDPWVAWMHLMSSEVIAEFSVGLAILGVSVVGSVVYDRFFCKYACPMGAFLGVLSWASLFKVARNAETCTNCSACDKACPVNVKVSTAEVVNDPECINCNECVNVCPVKDTLSVSAPLLADKKRSLSPLWAMGGVVGMLLAVVAATTLTGTFAWAPPSLASTAAASSEGAGAAPVIDVESIRGSMTFAEVAKAAGIPASAFEERFGLTEAELAQPMKDLAESHGFDVHTDVREFVKAKMAASAQAQ